MNFAEYWEMKLKKERKRKLRSRRKPKKDDNDQLQNTPNQTYYSPTAGTNTGTSGSSFVMKG